MGITYQMSWQQVLEAMEFILGQFEEDNYRPLWIIGVGKGGVIPANLIHQHFPDAFFATIQVKCYTSEFVCEAPRFLGPIPNFPATPKTLIVDDIYETGQTYRFLHTRWPHCTYAFMSCRAANAGQCKYRGKLWEPGWVEFPWEKKLEPVEIPF